MFFERYGEIYRVLLEADGGYYMISCEEPKKGIVFVSIEASDEFYRVVAPDFFIANMMRTKPLTPSVQAKTELIQPLLDDRACIVDRKKLTMRAAEIAASAGTTKAHVLSLYYIYLGKGGLTITRKPNQKCEERDKLFDKAIRTYYYSAKRPSLSDAYNLMLTRYYTDGNGKLQHNYPSFKSFQHFFYRKGYHKSAQKEIARDGLSQYLRNSRPLYGAQNTWHTRCGVFQMDATEADVYIVDEYDRNIAPARPNIYLAVDTASRLIAGIYVGFDQGESAVLSCLANAAVDKRVFCRKYGVDITESQWPNRGLPKRVVIDRGNEFFGERMNELCVTYGVEIERLPPFRPDQKGMVEKMFDMLQEKYKPFLRGKGVVEADAKERWSVDYRGQAKFTLAEFTSIIVRCVVFLNSARVLDDLLPEQKDAVPTPAGLWKWCTEHNRNDVVEVRQRDIYCLALPRKDGRLTRAGLVFQKLRYINLDEKQEFYEAGKFGSKKVMVAYDPNRTSRIYWVRDGAYIEFNIAPADQRYGEMSFAEYQEVCKRMKAMADVQREKSTAERVALQRHIDDIMGKKEDGEDA